jgi:EF-hand domain pair
MSKKVLLIAGVVLAAGSVAALSSPYFRGAQLRLGQILGEFGDDDSGPRPGRSGKRHRQMDADDDRNVGREEFANARRARSAQREVEGDATDMPVGPRERTGRRARDRDVAEAEPGEEAGRAGKAATRARHGGSERATGRDDRQFARLDRNGDGFIDAKEFETWVVERAVRAAQRFIERFDADGDGKVSKDEFRRFAKDRLSGRSGDADDQIMEAELEPARPGRGILK